MKRLTMMVTPDGRWVFPDSDEFHSALGDPNPDYDALAFAVKNLGFIRFHAIEQSIIEIELHPRNVALPALLAVQQQLHSSNVRLFRVKYFDTAWQSEISSSAELTIARLSQLCTAAAEAPKASDRFLVEPQDFVKLYDKEESPFRPLAQKWRISFAQFDPSVIALAVRHGLLSRMMIAGVSPANPQPVFRFIGDGFKSLDKDYPFYGVGEPIENLPDKDYGGWVAQFYRSVALTHQPRYDIVTAAIAGRTERRGPFLTRYERLLLPWKTPSEEVFVTLVSKSLDAPSVEGSSTASAVFNDNVLAKSS